MATAFDTLDAATHDQMAVTFSALLLHDENIEVNADNLKKVLAATGNKVEAYWPMLFANALSGRNMGDFLAVSGGSGPAQAQTSAPAQGGNAAPAKEEKKEEPEEEEE